MSTVADNLSDILLRMDRWLPIKGEMEQKEIQIREKLYETTVLIKWESEEVLVFSLKNKKITWCECGNGCHYPSCILEKERVLKGRIRQLKDEATISNNQEICIVESEKEIIIKNEAGNKMLTANKKMDDSYCPIIKNKSHDKYGPSKFKIPCNSRILHGKVVIDKYSSR